MFFENAGNRPPVRRFDQSDGLDVEQVNLGADYRIADGCGRIGPRLRHAAFDPPDARGDVFTVTRIAASSGWRLSDAIDLNATIGVDSIDAPGPGLALRTFVTVSLPTICYPTFHPAEQLAKRI